MLGFENLKNLIFTSYAQKITKDKTIYPYKISLEYILSDYTLINNTNLLEELTKFISNFNEVVIKSNQVFSFCKIFDTSKPTNPILVHLVSSIIYQLALTCNVEIKERHHFKYDLYSDKNRLFPLGADADIDYGTKDLRFKNRYPFPVKLRLELSENKLRGEIVSKEKINYSEINFKKINHKNCIEIFTRVNKRTVAVSIYKLNSI
ncbi:VanW family protein [Apibacter raozihei]|uniref:VanW family protein n=1 Tax=Apibacter raozihei TaxID=2500547 RepID=UPI000FE2FFCF|nr:VanW family protein [Apibacter raozihei]